MKKLNKYIGWISLIVAIVALGVSLFQSKDKDYDNMMFAVAMLSALVTILIGWNIYSLIDMRSFKDEVSEKLSKQREEYFDWIDQTQEGIRRVNTILMKSMFLSFNKDNEIMKDAIFVDFGLKTIHGDIGLNNIVSAQRIINELIGRIPGMQPVVLEHKINMLTQLKEIEELIDSKNIKDVQNISILKSHIYEMDSL